MSKILYNKYKDRLEITGDNKVAFYSQKREQLKTLYNDKYVVDLGGGLGYNVSRKFIPNLEDATRRFIERTDNVILDSIADRDAQLLLPVSSFDGVDGKVNIITGFSNSSNFVIKFKIKGLLAEQLTSYVGILSTTGSSTSSGTIHIEQQSSSISLNLNVRALTAIDRIQLPLANVLDGENHDIDILCNDGLISVIKDGVIIHNAVGVSGDEYDISKLIIAVNGDRYFNGYIYDIELINGDEYVSVPLPHLCCGFNSNGNKIDLDVVGGVNEGFNEQGSTHLIDKGCIDRDGDIIPNNNEGLPTVELQDGDTLIKGTSFINTSPFKVDMNPIDNATDVEYLFFDKSNVLIWKDEVRSSGYYDSLNPYNWHSSELTQQFIYDNVQDTEKYKWWSKETNGSFKDLFLYNTALDGSDICPAKNYVGLGEVYDVADAHLIACSIDTTPAITILEDTTILTDNTILE